MERGILTLNYFLVLVICLPLLHGATGAFATPTENDTLHLD